LCIYIIYGYQNVEKG